MFLNRLGTFDHIAGKLGRDIDLVTKSRALQNLSERHLAAGVDIGGIEIIHTIINRHF